MPRCWPTSLHTLFAREATLSSTRCQPTMYPKRNRGNDWWQQRKILNSILEPKIILLPSTNGTLHKPSTHTNISVFVSNYQTMKLYYPLTQFTLNANPRSASTEFTPSTIKTCSTILLHTKWCTYDVHNTSSSLSRHNMQTTQTLWRSCKIYTQWSSLLTIHVVTHFFPTGGVQLKLHCLPSLHEYTSHNQTLYRKPCQKIWNRFENRYHQ